MYFKALLAMANINLWLILPGDFASPGHTEGSIRTGLGVGALWVRESMNRDWKGTKDHRHISQQDPRTSSEPPSPEAGFLELSRTNIVGCLLLYYWWGGGGATRKGEGLSWDS